MNTKLKGHCFLEANTITKASIHTDSPKVRSCYRIPSFEEFDIKHYRESLGMTQKEFANIHNISIGTLRKWERGLSEPVFGSAFKRIFRAWLTQKCQLTYS